MIVGADTGGTYTDLVDDRGRVVKVLSTPDDPARALGTALHRVAEGGGADVLAHGTTVATNALVERRGARVALVTTEGLADVIEIGRQDRPSLYDLFEDRPAPLVPRELRLEVAGRLDATGQVLRAVDPGALEVPDGVDAVAVCLLHADLNDTHERAVAEALAGRGLDVVLSSEVSPEFREYERAVTTVADAYLRPVCRDYLRRVAGLAGEVLVMTSAGGLVPLETALDHPVRLLLSGPAGGVRATAALAAACGFSDAVSLDMGGTSTDVCLIVGSVPEPAPSRDVGGLPIRVPALDIHTIGAGGGSIAEVDPGGALTVGPGSAGADPGPVCYGRGGSEPTVTDADLLLGRIDAQAPLPGLGRLDVEQARRAFEAAGIDPAGVVRVIDSNMERALRAVSVERGVDPRGLALVAFGGAGPLHACALADSLGMPTVVVPPRAGVFSAVGLTCAPRQQELVRSWPTPQRHDGLAQALAEWGAEAASRVAPGRERETTVVTSVDCRYRGQSHEITVPSVAAFHDEHRRRNGFHRPDAPVEVIALRARARLAPALEPDDLPRVERARTARGPAVLAEPDCTVWVAEGWAARLHEETGAWILERTP